MNRRIRLLAVFLMVCFGLLFLQLNNLQVRQANTLKNSPYEAPPISSWNETRGAIVSSDGVVLADTTPSSGYFNEQRHYPEGSLFADITGYVDVTQYAIPQGLEAEYNSYLLPHRAVAHNLDQILTERTGTDTIETTVSVALQKVAQQALAGRIGAVVAIDPQTGAILAMYSNPTYDPNVLASHDVNAVKAAFTKLEDPSDPSASPLINGATLQTYPPGSTFKVVTTSAIYDHKPSLASEIIKPTGALALPETNLLLHNYGGEVCGGTLANNLAVSCDTAYGKIGLQLGARSLASEAHAFGFNHSVPIDLPQDEVSAASFPSVASLINAPPYVAYSAIGQFDVTESALVNALVASGIADNGTIMTPHLLANIVDDEGHLVKTYKPHAWLHATSATTANEVRNLMLGVTKGNGTAAGVGFPASLNVAAKTGTAETGALNCSADWLIATAPAGTGQTPTVAVAAVLPAQANLTCSETGAEAAGPVVKSVLDAALGYRS